MTEPADTTARPVRILVDLAALEALDLRVGDLHRAALRNLPPELPNAAASTLHAGTAHRTHLDRAALPTIGRLAREGALELCTYAEFDPPGQRAHWHGTWRELLGEVPVTVIAPALSREELGDDVFRDTARAGALVRLCTRLKHTEPHTRDAAPAGAESPTPASLERFRQLSARVQGDHLADLFHLWSGEAAGCRYCLATDDGLEDFIRDRVAPHLEEPLACTPVRPEDLLRKLGVEARDPRPDDPQRVVSILSRSHGESDPNSRSTHDGES